MSEIQWMPLKCASCSGLLRVPVSEASDSVACPHCQALLVVPSSLQSTVQIARELPESEKLGDLGKFPRRIQAIPTDSAIPKNLKRLASGQMAPYIEKRGGDSDVESEDEVPDGHLPPKKKAPKYTSPEMIVLDANSRKARESEPEKKKDEEPEQRTPKMTNLGSTADVQFALSEEEAVIQKQRMAHLPRGRKVDLTGWDRDEEAETINAVSPAMALILKMKRPMMFAIVLLFAGLVVYGVISMNSEPKETPIKETEAPAEVAPTLADEMKKEEGLEEMATAALAAFLDAESLSERLKWVRDLDRVKPIMEAYYATHDVKITYRNKPRVENVVENFAISQVEMEDFTTVSITVERVGEEFKVDWESFVAYSEMTFAEFKEAKSDKPVLLRVMAAVDNYFNYGFEESVYYCLRLEEPKTGEVLYVYAEKTSDVGKALSEQMKASSGYLVLKLRKAPDGAAKNQALIDEFVQRGWVIRPMVEEEKPLTIDQIDINPPPGK